MGLSNKRGFEMELPREDLSWRSFCGLGLRYAKSLESRDFVVLCLGAIRRAGDLRGLVGALLECPFHPLQMDLFCGWPAVSRTKLLLGGVNVTHWTFAIGEVRVFDLCFEFFQIFWRVVDSVPTHGSYFENCGLISPLASFLHLGDISTMEGAWSLILELVGGEVFNPNSSQALTFGAQLLGLEPSPRLDWKGFSSHLELGKGLLHHRHDDRELDTIDHVCLPLCSFAHACEGRSPQAGTPEIAYATQARSCGIGRQNGMPWGRLIPRVGMLTTTGPFLARHKPDYTRVDP
uniref:Uncharacterized protein n=1 Tax=Ananas comosus var. bracteatus TaxID=296719 RepID=A0A6V7PH40_ANACO|nr:unnamed protein product [Ananas comosus var. bracteatus]